MKPDNTLSMWEREKSKRSLAAATRHYKSRVRARRKCFTHVIFVFCKTPNAGQATRPRRVRPAPFGTYQDTGQRLVSWGRAGYAIVGMGDVHFFGGAEMSKPRLPTLCILLIAGVITLGLTLYPPWCYTLQRQGISQASRPGPRALLWNPPPVEPRTSFERAYTYGVRLDYERWLVECIAVCLCAAVGAGAIYLVRLDPLARKARDTFRYLLAWVLRQTPLTIVVSSVGIILFGVVSCQILFFTPPQKEKVTAPRWQQDPQVAVIAPAPAPVARPVPTTKSPYQEIYDLADSVRDRAVPVAQPAPAQVPQTAAPPNPVNTKGKAYPVNKVECAYECQIDGAVYCTVYNGSESPLEYLTVQVLYRKGNVTDTRELEFRCSSAPRTVATWLLQTGVNRADFISLEVVRTKFKGS